MHSHMRGRIPQVLRALRTPLVSSVKRTGTGTERWISTSVPKGFARKEPASTPSTQGSRPPSNGHSVLRAPWRHLGERVLNKRAACWQDTLGPGGCVEDLGADYNDPRDRAQNPQGFTWSCCQARGDQRECSRSGYGRPPQCTPYSAHVWRPYNDEDDDVPWKYKSRRCNVCAAWECDVCPKGGTHQWAYTRPGKKKSSVRCDKCKQPPAEGVDRTEVRNPFKKEKPRPHQGERELRDGWEDDYYEYAGDEDVHAPPNERDNPEYYVWTCCGQPCDEGDECPDYEGSNYDSSDEGDDDDDW